MRLLDRLRNTLKPPGGRGDQRRRPPREKMVRVRVRVSGTVQGVYYRAHARRKAVRLGVAGWIRNLDDGTVEALVEGNEPSVREFLEWCRRGSPRSTVESVDVVWEPHTGEFDRFSAR